MTFPIFAGTINFKNYSFSYLHFHTSHNLKWNVSWNRAILEKTILLFKLRSGKLVHPPGIRWIVGDNYNSSVLLLLIVILMLLFFIKLTIELINYGLLFIYFFFWFKAKDSSRKISQCINQILIRSSNNLFSKKLLLPKFLRVLKISHISSISFLTLYFWDKYDIIHNYW